MAEGNGTPKFSPRSGRDLFMVPQSDRLNDQFRLIDTLVLSMTDSWAYLPPRAKHILWLKLASCDRNFLEQCGMPLENGILLHWSMWPDDLGDYAQAVSLRSSRQQLEYLEPKNVAMASAIRQAEMAENSWLTVPADHRILFHYEAADRLAAAGQTLGIDIDLLSADAGHA